MAVMIAFAIAMTLSIGAVPKVFAAGGQGNITINGTSEGKTIDVYQIFSATKSADNKVSYKLNTAYEGYFTENVTSCNGKTGDALSEAAYAYVSALDKSTGNETEHVAFAKSILNWTLTTTNKPTAVDTLTVGAGATSVTTKALDYGYYLVYPKGAGDTTGAGTKSPAVLVNLTQDAITINLKSAYPTVDKKVGDTDYTDASIGDMVTYTLTSHVPDMTGYSAYTFKFLDTLSKGLTFGQITSVKVGNDTLAAGTTGKTYAVTNTSDAGAGTTALTVTLNDFYNQYKNQVGDAIVVTYTATVNTDAVIGINGNTNKAQVEYSNDPSDASKTDKTPEDEVPVYTFDFTINKFYMNNDTETALAGVGFKLYSDEACNTEILLHKVEGKDVYQKAADNGVEIITPASGKAQVTGLDAGTYYLKETTTPDGYNKLLGPVKLVITPTYDANKLTSYKVTATYNGANVDSVVNTAGTSPEVKIENKTGAELPNTGGRGIFYLTIAGVLVLAVTITGSVVSKKRKQN